MTAPIPASPRKTRVHGTTRPFTAALLVVAWSAGTAAAQAPLTLAAVIRAAREQSDETRLVEEKSAKLEAMKRELWAGALPRVEGYANVGRGGSPFDLSSLGFGGDSIPPVINQAQTRYSYGVQVTQPIYSFGRLGQSFRTAGKQIGAQDEANRRSLQEIELQALDAYYAVVLAEARQSVIAAAAERQKRTTAFLESNFRGGAGSRGTILLATAALKGLEPERIRAERDADAARMALNRLIGRPVTDSLVLDTSQAAGWSVPVVDTSEAALRKVLDNRPDLASLRLQRQTMQGYATAYRMQYLPSLGFQGRWGILAYQADEQLTDFDNNLEWQVGVGLTWPLFDGFAMSSKARQYDSDARSVAIAERQARAFARIELESAQREAQAADTALAAAQSARDASTEALDLIGRDFRAGSGQLTDLLSAEEGLRNAELALLSARYQRVRAQASLRLALGMDLIKEIAE